MSAGCQRPGGSAIKSARREGLGWAAGGLLRNKTARRVTARALRREAVSALGSQGASCSHSPAAGGSCERAPRRHSHGQRSPGAPERPPWSCHRPGAMTEGQPQSSDARARLPQLADGNESGGMDACPGYSARGRMWGSWSRHGHSQLCKQPRRGGDLPCPATEVAHRPLAGSLFPCPKTGQAKLLSLRSES